MNRIHVLLLGAAALAAAALGLALRPELPSAERGRRLAEKTGCFACHGPGGTGGVANAGRVDGTVPNFADDVMMYAKSAEEIDQWIRDGETRRKAASATWRAERGRGALRMPAFKGRMGERDVHDLVAYVRAVAGDPAPPESSLAAHGLARAESLGCVGCHGPGGRLARPNPGSFKGVVPSWDGADFAELVKDSVEFRQWVEHGVSARLHHNGIASFFLENASLRMPAFESHLAPGDVPALWAYVTWLRSEAHDDHD